MEKRALEVTKQERGKEAATTEIEQTYARRQRRQRVAIAVLVVTLLALVLYLLFGP